MVTAEGRTAVAPVRERRRAIISIQMLMIASVAMVVFLGLTNKWVSWNTGIYQFHLTDDINYRAMAAAAPDLLHRHIAEWHAERFAVQWVVGGTAKLLSISLFASYRVWLALIVFAICFALAELLVRIHVSVPAAIVCIAAVVLNAYLIRPLMIAPGGVADLVFVLGTAIAVRGLVLRSPTSLLAGLALATIARQTAVPCALVAAGAVLLDSAWRARLPRGRVALAAAAVILPIACYAVIRIVAHQFSGPSPSVHTVTLLGTSFAPKVLAQHFGRCVNGLLSVGGLLAGAWWARRSARQASAGRVQPETPGAMAAVYACLAFGAAIVIQPALLNPKWASYNEVRLAVIGIVPLIVAAALLLRELERARARPLSWQNAAVLVGLLAVASLHHIYTRVGTGSTGQTVGLQVVVGAALAVVLARAFRGSPAAA